MVGRRFRATAVANRHARAATASYSVSRHARAATADTPACTPHCYARAGRTINRDCGIRSAGHGYSNAYSRDDCDPSRRA